MVLPEHVERHARLVVIHLVTGGLGHASEEVRVAAPALGKQDQVEAALLGAPLDTLILDEVALAAKDGLHLEGWPVLPDGSEIVRRLPDPAIALPLSVGAIAGLCILRVRCGLLKLPALLEALQVMLPLLHGAGGLVVLAAL